MPAGRVRAGLRILPVRGSEREQPRDVPRQRYEAAIAASLDRAPARHFENTVVSYQPPRCRKWARRRLLRPARRDQQRRPVSRPVRFDHGPISQLESCKPCWRRGDAKLRREHSAGTFWHTEEVRRGDDVRCACLASGSPNVIGAFQCGPWRTSALPAPGPWNLELAALSAETPPETNLPEDLLARDRNRGVCWFRLGSGRF